MLSSNHMSAIVLAVLLAIGATGADAEERCTGTLCDLYYGQSSPAEKPAAKSAAPTPLMVPSLFPTSGATAPAGTPTNGAAPAPTSRVQVQGGGLLGLMRGQPNERCTGTLCDFYYGGSPPEKPEAAPVAANPQADTSEPAAAGDEPEEAPRSRRRPRYETVERETKPHCAATAQDPWRCYR